MIAKDEQALLAGALASVAFADERIVGIDRRTTDHTMRVALDGGARVHSFDWEDDFAAARNLGLTKATKDWILVIDADDRLTDWGARIIREAMRRPRAHVDAYGLIIENRKLDDTPMQVDPLPSVRLWPNHRGIHYVNRVHEVPCGPHGDLTIGWLRGGNGIVHYGYDPTIYELRHKDQRNASLLIAQLEETPMDRLLWYEFTRQHVIGRRYDQAIVAAGIALELPGYLRPELIAELERIVTLDAMISSRLE